jgi:hypothetical protein
MVTKGGPVLGRRHLRGAPPAAQLRRDGRGQTARLCRPPKGLPPLAGREKAEARYAVFVSQRPKGKLKLPSNVVVIGAREVFEALR